MRKKDRNKQLTDMACRNAKPGATESKMTDSHGLYLLVTPAGGKLWRYKYRFAGKQKSMALGVYPMVSLDDARTARMEARKLVKAGIDPGEVKKEKKVAAAEVREPEAAKTFAEVFKAWFAWWSVNKDWEKTASKLQDRFDNHVLKVIGHKPIDEVDAGDIRDLIKKIEKGGAGHTAMRIQGTIGQVYAWAIANRLARHNPAKDFTPLQVLKPMKVVHRAAVDENEFPVLVAKVWHYVGGKRSPVTLIGMKLMLYTFLRTMETRLGVWSELNYKEHVWDIPAKRMKKVKGQSLPHVVPMARQVEELFVELRQLTGGTADMMMPSRRAGRPMTENAMLFALYDLGYKGIQTGHGFRTLASTFLNKHKREIGKGVTEQAIEAQLSHVKRDKTAATYNRWEYMDERREFMQWWADKVDEALEEGREILGLQPGVPVPVVDWRPRDVNPVVKLKPARRTTAALQRAASRSAAGQAQPILENRRHASART